MDDGEMGDQNGSSENSRVPSDQETRITIREDDCSEDSGSKSGEFDLKSKGSTLERGVNDGLGGEGDQYSSVVNFKPGKLDGENQRLCRICHLSKSENEAEVLDFVELGCGCRGDLGFAHSVCAETWFKLKGNRLCEICGVIAKNVTCTGDSRFMQEWNEDGLAGGASASSERRRGCWHAQPLCNFLMACLVIAFVLPWFFHVNMFSL